jgi:hypothetical protein
LIIFLTIYNIGYRTALLSCVCGGGDAVPAAAAAAGAVGLGPSPGVLASSVLVAAGAVGLGPSPGVLASAVLVDVVVPAGLGCCRSNSCSPGSILDSDLAISHSGSGNGNGNGNGSGNGNGNGSGNGSGSSNGSGNVSGNVSGNGNGNGKDPDLDSDLAPGQGEKGSSCSASAARLLGHSAAKVLADGKTSGSGENSNGWCSSGYGLGLGNTAVNHLADG